VVEEEMGFDLIIHTRKSAKPSRRCVETINKLIQLLVQ